jgi:hypothetical protein
VDGAVCKKSWLDSLVKTELPPDVHEALSWAWKRLDGLDDRAEREIVLTFIDRVLDGARGAK